MQRLSSAILLIVVVVVVVKIAINIDSVDAMQVFGLQGFVFNLYLDGQRLVSGKRAQNNCENMQVGLSASICIRICIVLAVDFGLGVAVAVAIVVCHCAASRCRHVELAIELAIEWPVVAARHPARRHGHAGQRLCRGTSFRSAAGSRDKICNATCRGRHNGR